MKSNLLADAGPLIGLTRNFQYCFKITNLDRYPDHLFFAELGSQNDRLTVVYRLIRPNTCIPAFSYRPLTIITAIPKNQIKPDDLENFSSDPNDLSFMVLLDKTLQSKLLKGQPKIQPPYNLPMIYESANMEDSIEIKTLTSDNLQINVTRSIHTLNWIIFPILGTLLLGYLFWKRRRKAL
jgi:hypothetical protein